MSKVVVSSELYCVLLYVNFTWYFTAGEISSTVAHIMVPNPTKSIIAETQSRLTDIIRELEKNLSRLIMLVGDKDLNTSIERSVESCNHSAKPKFSRFIVPNNSRINAHPPLVLRGTVQKGWAYFRETMVLHAC